MNAIIDDHFNVSKRLKSLCDPKKEIFFKNVERKEEKFLS